ncbi:hypothetical protein H8L32_10640 [Undibacterium sp. CY18W]|uniref:HEAT repeat protein n=1 Tax=Undibacterium hunanense TaxID=2762292 RepID=A0ABR6ZPV2_9BURK|nr:hypothetical protein [Undibacterium hunanense]MBC3917932.1 hypothetical protein [Undibacterium hunanense]
MQGIIKLVKLRRSKPSERHCEIELIQAPQTPQAPQIAGDTALYLVNLREGHLDAEWQESTKTPFAVSLDKAEALFAQSLTSKLEQGFVDTALANNSIHPVQAEPAVSDAMQWGHSAQVLPGKIARPSSVAGQEKILLDRLQPRAWSGLSQIERSRTVWRIGERRMRAAVPRMVELLETGNAMLDYCLAYAIGRCGDAGAAQAMQALSQRSQYAHVVQIARQAWLTLVDVPGRQQHARDLIATWPDELQTAWQKAEQSQNVEEIMFALPSASNWKNWRHDDWLEQLDCIALSGISTLARPLLLQQLKNLPVSTQVFRAFRHLYKAAEFRVDAELFGILHQRFEKAWPLFVLAAHSDRIHLERRYVRYADEVKKADTRVAYSSLTRNYLRRRSWRSLRRLGELQSPDFVTLATGVLLACDDAQANVARIQRLVEWNRSTRAYDTELRYISPYGQWMLFNQLLHRHQSEIKTSRTAKLWWQPAQSESLVYPQRQVRQEAFPHLWDAAPEQLLSLLQQSRCLGVHAFAARALIDNTAFCQQLDLQQLQQLLQSAYLPTKEMAFAVIRQRFAGQTPDLNWLLILLNAGFSPAAEFALEFISKTPENYAQQPGLLLAMITNPLPGVRASCRLLAQAAQAATRQNLLRQFATWVQLTEKSAQDIAVLQDDLQWLIQNLLADHVAQLSDAELASWCELLNARHFWQQSLATDILVTHPAGIAHVSPQVLRGLLQDSDAGRQSLGSRLFAALPSAVLLEQPDLVGSLATADDARVRAAMTAVINDLAAHPVFSEKLLVHFFDALFRSDTTDGEDSLHADILRWCSGPLLAATLVQDTDQQWRLLQARSKGAQEMGAILLSHPDSPLAASLGVLQWALLGRHAVLQVRLLAQAYFSNNLSLIRADLDNALRILDTRWPETRAFATDFFARYINADEWSLAQLLALCDHPQAAVQRLGRQLITRHYRAEDATEYVLSLSQHPAASMQLFVSQWLEQSIHAASDMPQALHNLQQLRPYFLSVLSHVNKARTVKNRVISFLQQQGVLSASHAQFVAQIFTRQVLTVAIQDKAQYIVGLTQLQDLYPALAQEPDWPVQVVAPRILAMATVQAVISAESV